MALGIEVDAAVPDILIVARDVSLGKPPASPIGQALTKKYNDDPIGYVDWLAKMEMKVFADWSAGKGKDSKQKGEENETVADDGEGRVEQLSGELLKELS